MIAHDILPARWFYADIVPVIGPATRTFNPYATGLHSGSSRQTGAQTNQFNITRDESGNTTTDPQLLSKKVRAYVRVGATPGEKEQLDKSQFTPGSVLHVLTIVRIPATKPSQEVLHTRQGKYSTMSP